MSSPVEDRTVYIYNWIDGFSVARGPLRRFDDRQNQADFDLIKAGSASRELLGIPAGENFTVVLVDKKDYEYFSMVRVSAD